MTVSAPSGSVNTVVALYLIAAHLVGDFIVQDRWRATLKFTDTSALWVHSFWYTLSVAVAAMLSGTDAWKYAAFVFAVFTSHLVIDSRRYRSTFGDVVQWRLGARRDPQDAIAAWGDYLIQQDGLHAEHENTRLTGRDSIDPLRWPPPNPWPPTVIMIDQTLHLTVLAVLGGLLLT
jgi:hypothetical protein